MDESTERVIVFDTTSKYYEPAIAFSERSPAGGIAAMKRSAVVKLVLMGAGALSLYAIYRENECRNLPPEQQQACRGSRSNNTSSRIWSSSSRTSQSAPRSSVSRGGFGSVSRAISGASRGS